MSYDAIVIPTYGRGATIGTDTLSTLANLGVDMSAVHVYIGGNPDGYAYAMASHNTVQWRTAPTGKQHALTHIHQQYPAGHRIVSIDDDVLSIDALTPDGKKLRPLTPDQWAETTATAFRILEDGRLTLWGVSPSENPFYMSHQASVGLKFCTGQLYGYINSPGMEIVEEAKEDFEVTLIHYERAGATVRLNNISPRTRPIRSNPGGIQAMQHDRDAKERTARTNMMERWPSLVRPIEDGYNGITLRKPRKGQQ